MGWKRRRSDAELERLEAQLPAALRRGSRMPGPDEPDLRRARARVGFLLHRQAAPQPRLSGLRRLPYALAGALGGTGLGSVLFGLAAAHKVAAAGLAAGIVLGGGLAADATNVGPPAVLELAGFQTQSHSDDASEKGQAARTAAYANAAGQDDGSDVPVNSQNDGQSDGQSGGQGGGQDFGPLGASEQGQGRPQDNHGADVSAVASDKDPEVTTEGAEDGNHGQAVSEVAGQGHGPGGNPQANADAQGHDGLASCATAQSDGAGGQGGPPLFDDGEEPGAQGRANAEANKAIQVNSANAGGGVQSAEHPDAGQGNAGGNQGTDPGSNGVCASEVAGAEGEDGPPGNALGLGKDKGGVGPQGVTVEDGEVEDESEDED